MQAWVNEGDNVPLRIGNNLPDCGFRITPPWLLWMQARHEYDYAVELTYLILLVWANPRGEKCMRIIFQGESL